MGLGDLWGWSSWIYGAGGSVGLELMDLWGWRPGMCGAGGLRSVGLGPIEVWGWGESMGLGPTDVWGWEMCGAETHRSVGRLPFVALQNNP